MKISEFKYNLPKEKIAQFPPEKRGTTNLLILDRKKKGIVHRKYFNIPEYIKEDDLVVLNETQVINSRTYFNTLRGKQVEVLFLEKRNEKVWFSLIGRARNVRDGDILKCEDIHIRVGEREENGFLVEFVKGDAETLFRKHGHTPLPPYMNREDNKEDRKRYNTVFSTIPGAVAAPTASLNLTEEILGEIEKKGAQIAKIELKVGWGTFAPIREENIEEHNIHKEYMNINLEVAEKINECKGRVWVFGTTVARALESAYSDDTKDIRSYSGFTDLYIYPGYEWKVVDVLVTNFHMPDSSLILLVSSFAGKENIHSAYQEAIRKGYKFLSYGDSMLIGDNLIEGEQ